VCAPPHATAATFEAICVGPASAVVPLPSCPDEFDPQQLRFLPESTTQVCCAPVQTCTAVVKPDTTKGVGCAGKRLSPSCRDSFAPQHATVLSASVAQVCAVAKSVGKLLKTAPPRATVTAPAGSAILFGWRTSLDVPSPTCPRAFPPQQ